MRHRILPPADELAKQLESDHSLTFTALAEKYGVSRQAVMKAINKAHIELERPKPHSLKQFVPWRVKVAHEQDLNVRMLRLYARQILGFPIPKDRQKKYAEWRQYMDALDLVVTYSPETGFAVDERRPGDERYWRP